MSEFSTLGGIQSDLALAEADLVKAESALIDAMEHASSAAQNTSNDEGQQGNADTSNTIEQQEQRPKKLKDFVSRTIPGLEEDVQQCRNKRDDLIDVKHFVIERERERCVRDAKSLSTVLYISKWSDELNPATDISAIAFHGNMKNEGCGLTGILYVFRGWFGGYLEGEEHTLNKTLKQISQDTRHCNLSVLKRVHNLPAATTARKFPKTGLALQWLNALDVDSKTDAEATFLQYLTHHLALTHYVPRPIFSMQQLQITRESSTQMDDVKRVVSVPFPPTTVKQCLLCITPSECFWEQGGYQPNAIFDCVSAGAKTSLASAQLEIIQRIYNIVKQVIERPTEMSDYVNAGATSAVSNPDHQPGCVIMPHSADLGFLCSVGVNAEAALMRAQKIWKEIQEASSAIVGQSEEQAVSSKVSSYNNNDDGASNSSLFYVYCPTITLHYCDVEVIMNGSCTVIGPALRYIRQLTTIAKQEGYVMATSENLADEALRTGLTSLGHFMFHKRPDEVFCPDNVAALRWGDLVIKRKKECIALSDAASQGQVVQKIASMAALKAAKPKKHITADEVNEEPVKGVTTDAELREMFNALGPDAEKGNTIALDDFARLYHGSDQMGVVEMVGEMEKMLKGSYSSGEDGDRMTFDQFSLMWYRKMRL